MQDPNLLTTARLMHHLNQQMKIIFNLRHPVERMWSAIRFSLKIRSVQWAENTGNDNFLHAENTSLVDFTEVTERMIQIAIETWEICLEKYGIRQCAFAKYITQVNPALKDLDPDWCHTFINALRYSIYYIYIQEFLEYFPEDNILLVSLDNLAQDPMKMLKESICPFLGLSPNIYPSSLRKYDRISNINRLVTYEIPKHIYDMISNFLRPYTFKINYLMVSNQIDIWK